MTDVHDMAVLDSGAELMFEGGGKSRFATIDQYELPAANLRRYICLLIGGSCDQEFLTKHREIVRAFLDDGKVLVFGGHLFRPWLPGGSDFIPREIKRHTDYHITILQEEPFFMGVNPLELTYRKGVAGFFARGHHPLPEGAIPLLALPGGEPTLYIDRTSTKGTLLVSSGATLLGFDRFEDSTRPITGRLLSWIREEYARLQRHLHKEVRR